MKTALIFGATSAIAQSAAEQLVQRGATLFLVGRNQNKLAILAQHLETLGGRSVAFATVSGEPAQHAAVLLQAKEKLGTIDFLLVAQGLLPDQARTEQDFAAAEEAMRVNLLEPISILHAAAPIFEAQGSGTIAAISSVAADRGRQSNYLYGATKAGLDTVLSGLRNRLFSKGVQVLTIKPGFVDTPMTAAMKKTPMFASPATIASGILKAAEAKKDLVYLPGRWRLIMFIIRSIPEPIFKRLRL